VWFSRGPCSRRVAGALLSIAESVAKRSKISAPVPFKAGAVALRFQGRGERNQKARAKARSRPKNSISSLSAKVRDRRKVK